MTEKLKGHEPVYSQRETKQKTLQNTQRITSVFAHIFGRKRWRPIHRYGSKRSR